MTRLPLVTVLLALIVAPALARAEVVELDINKESKYEKRVAKLKKGDTVVFQNGQRFKLGEYLGTGSENRVFALDADHVIRIPNRAMTGMAPAETLRGAPSLAALGVPAVRVEGAPLPKDVTDASEMEYAIAERVKKPWFTLEDFFDHRGEAAKLSKAQEKKITDLVVDYARKTALFEYLDSAGPDQILFTRDGKVLLVDWKGYHRAIDPKKVKSLKAFLARDNAFSQMLKVASGTEEQRRAARLGSYDEWDTDARYLSLNDNDRWLAMKDRIKQAIDDERTRIWQKYDGDLEKAFEKIAKKNLGDYEPLAYRVAAGCLGSIKEILKALRQ